MTEICGDVPLSLGEKLLYLSWNLARNLGVGRAGLGVRNFIARRLPDTHVLASPSRVLTEAFIATQLPQLLPKGEISILDIGCGSGRMASMLARAAYRGSYLGVDIEDRFSAGATPGLSSRFALKDAHTLTDTDKFDLIVSVSALEHIPNDRSLVERFPGMLAPGGIQLHFVPGAWSLPVYLWHGYRQYGLKSIAERFDSKQTVVYAIGGLCAFLVHLVMITFPEMIGHVNIRNRVPRFYRSLVNGALWIDRYLPFCPTMYGIASGSPMMLLVKGPK